MSEPDGTIVAESGSRRMMLPWQRGILWLLFLGPFFFVSYNFANWWTDNHADPGAFVFAWERNIPFLAWTIVPYWSIDLFYALSFLLCRDHHEVDIHAKRLLAVQLISIACFILFPLRFTFARPATDGAFGWMFDVLMGFDKPYNQAPSLHIGLLVIFWQRYGAAFRGALRTVVHVWAILIGISALTTYQHHFIDIPTGALVGFLCLWLLPDKATPPWKAWRMTASPSRLRVAACYLLGVAAFTGIACFGGIFLWVFWPAASLLIVALVYFGIGPDGFQKNGHSFSIAARWLLAPYLAGALINSRLWTRRRPLPDLIADEVWLGRMPTTRDMKKGGFSALLDLTAELPSPRGDWQTVNLQWLDLLPPDAQQLSLAASHIETLRSRGAVRVCCALGYSRSASAIAAWLLTSGRVQSVEEAFAKIALRRPNIKLGPAHRMALDGLHAQSQSQRKQPHA